MLRSLAPPTVEFIFTNNPAIKIGHLLFHDYKRIRRNLQALDWSVLSDEEKIFVAQHKATSDENCKTILGDSYEYWMTDFDLKSRACREFRFSFAETILRKNLSLGDRFKILGALNTTQLENNYIKYGIEGTQDNDPFDGLFNF